MELPIISSFLKLVEVRYSFQYSYYRTAGSAEDEVRVRWVEQDRVRVDYVALLSDGRDDTAEKSLMDTGNTNKND